MGKISRIDFMRNKALEIGEIDGHEWLILSAPFENALNGYIIFKDKPVIENDYDGIISYVPVHGGITMVDHSDDGSIYGFDTLHFDSESYPRADRVWIKEQISVMYYGILKAKEVERKYLKCVTNKGKAKYAQMVQDIQPELARNFRVSLNLLSGKL